MPSNDSLNFNITMLGARGVGKTSMLAAMWNEFDRVCDDPSLQFIPAPDTQHELTQRLAELKRLAAGRDGVVDLSRSIVGTSDIQHYSVEFFHTTSATSFNVVFTDYPGGWLSERAVAKTEKIDAVVGQARVILVAVDAPALMMLPDDKHELRNLPTHISATLQRAFRNHDAETRLVMFCLMRGERWLHEQRTHELLERFHQRFYAALKTLKGYQNSTTVVICPVQTLGAVRFAQFDANDIPIFEKIHDQDYRPVDCDQPLRYSLAYMSKTLSQYAEEQRQYAQDQLKRRGFWEKARDSTLGVFGWKSGKQRDFDAWLHRSTELRRSLRTYARNCKREAPIQLLQSQHLLDIQ